MYAEKFKTLCCNGHMKSGPLIFFLQLNFVPEPMCLYFKLISYINQNSNLKRLKFSCAVLGDVRQMTIEHFYILIIFFSENKKSAKMYSVCSSFIFNCVLYYITVQNRMNSRVYILDRVTHNR